ncbi:hypothetical protein C7E17_24820, partial [Stenotrophomonas maltophilia]
GSTGVQAGTPRWPAAQSHRDEHFGDVSVYFNQATATPCCCASARHRATTCIATAPR